MKKTMGKTLLQEEVEAETKVTPFSKYLTPKTKKSFYSDIKLQTLKKVNFFLLMVFRIMIK